MNITVIILTLNEERHIQRCIESIIPIASRVVVVDSFSTDRTCAMARDLGADVYCHEFINQAKQFNWALDNIEINTTWIMRLDADEYLINEHIATMRHALALADIAIDGFTLRLRRIFMGKWLLRGGLYPIRLLRLWRFGTGRYEESFMDEHVAVNGRVIDLPVDFADHNLHTLTWWTDKHNHYASREAVELLNLEFAFMPHDSVADLRGGQAGVKRWVKERVYARLPGGLRAFIYFLYRYLLRLGFLDGQAGLTFHFLQGFWYRYLVDAKVAEVKRAMREQGWDIYEAMEQVLGVRVNGRL